MTDEINRAAVVPSDVPETEEQMRERLKALRYRLQQEREADYTKAAIAMGLVSFMTWVKAPWKHFRMLHAFPNRKQRRHNQGVIAAIRSASKGVKAKDGVRVTLAQKRAAARRVEAGT